MKTASRLYYVCMSMCTPQHTDRLIQKNNVYVQIIIQITIKNSNKQYNQRLYIEYFIQIIM